MKPFTVYDDDGNILRSGYCQNHLVQAQARPWEHVIEGSANDEIERVDVRTRRIVRKDDAPPNKGGLR